MNVCIDIGMYECMYACLHVCILVNTTHFENRLQKIRLSSHRNAGDTQQVRLKAGTEALQ